MAREKKGAAPGVVGRKSCAVCAQRAYCFVATAVLYVLYSQDSAGRSANIHTIGLRCEAFMAEGADE